MQAFSPRLADLPSEIAVFPLTGALLLPRGRLPLNIGMNLIGKVFDGKTIILPVFVQNIFLTLLCDAIESFINI
jgi:hypothetical protein